LGIIKQFVLLQTILCFTPDHSLFYSRSFFVLLQIILCFVPDHSLFYSGPFFVLLQAILCSGQGQGQISKNRDGGGKFVSDESLLPYSHPRPLSQREKRKTALLKERVGLRPVYARTCSKHAPGFYL
jgi:hypothetical protein